MPGIDSIHTLLVGFFLQLLNQTFGNTIHTTNGGHNPNLITDTHVAILTYIALKATVVVFDIKLLVYRIICILESTSQIGLQIILVHPISGFHILHGMSDGIAIFDNVGTSCHVLYQYLMACWCILIHGNLLTIYFKNLSFLFGLQTNHYRIGRVNL